MFPYKDQDPPYFTLITSSLQIQPYYGRHIYSVLIRIDICSGPQHFWHQEPVLGKTIFPWTRKQGGWFWDDSSTFHSSSPPAVRPVPNRPRPISVHSLEGGDPWTSRMYTQREEANRRPVRRWPSASQGKRPQGKPTLQAP